MFFPWRYSGISCWDMWNIFGINFIFDYSPCADVNNRRLFDEQAPRAEANMWGSGYRWSCTNSIRIECPVFVVLCKIWYDCLYQNGKEKNSSLCVFVPRDATAVPDWETWALASWISTENGGKMIWEWGWRGCRKWWKVNMPVISEGLSSMVIKEGVWI